MNFYQDKKNRKNFHKGFSMGEVVLAAFILSFTLVVLLRVLSVSLKESIDSRDSIIATGLAQEGVELIRNLRDNNWANLGQGATSFTGFPATSAINCKIDKTAVNLSGIICDNTSKLLYYSSGFYVHAGTETTKFRRKVTLAYNTGQAASANTLTVNSMVVWNKSSDNDFPATGSCFIGNKCVYTEVVLYRWNE